MAPIKVGFLGLSKSGWAPGAHLPYLQASPDYEIVAICNSSVESSKEAIKLYKLPESTKAYGDPEGGHRLVFEHVISPNSWQSWRKTRKSIWLCAQ